MGRVYNQNPLAWLGRKDPSVPEQQKRNRGIVEGTPSVAGVKGGDQTHEAGPLPGRKTCERRGGCFGTEAAAR